MPLPQPIKNNLSIFNPTDMAAMKQEGGFTGNMTLRQGLEKLGFNLEGPISQLQEFAKKQMGNANPLTKMQNMSQPPGQGGPPPGMPPGGNSGPPPGGMPPTGAPPPTGQGLAGLVGR